MVESHSNKPKFESRDVSVRGVFWFAVGLVASAIVIHFAIAGLFAHLRDRYPSPDSPSRIAFNAHMIAPAPQLQTNPQADLEKLRAEEESKLNGYSWVDRQTGVVRIPIERAMELIARRGLPVRGSGTPDASGVTPIDMQREKATATKP